MLFKTDDSSGGSDKGAEIVHPGQSFREPHPSAGAEGSPAAEAARSCCHAQMVELAWTRSETLKNSSQPGLTPLFHSA